MPTLTHTVLASLSAIALQSTYAPDLPSVVAKTAAAVLEAHQRSYTESLRDAPLSVREAEEGLREAEADLNISQSPFAEEELSGGNLTCSGEDAAWSSPTAAGGAGAAFVAGVALGQRSVRQRQSQRAVIRPRRARRGAAESASPAW